jgi:hypothetical protein
MMQNMLLVFAGGIFYRTQEREHFQVSRWSKGKGRCDR